MALGSLRQELVGLQDVELVRWEIKAQGYVNPSVVPEHWHLSNVSPRLSTTNSEFQSRQ